MEDEVGKHERNRVPETERYRENEIFSFPFFSFFDGDVAHGVAGAAS